MVCSVIAFVVRCNVFIGARFCHDGLPSNILVVEQTSCLFVASWILQSDNNERNQVNAKAVMGSMGGVGLGLIPGLSVICELSLLLILSIASRVFSPGAPVFLPPQKSTFPNSNSTRNRGPSENYLHR
jgi:hypothetical protein